MKHSWRKTLKDRLQNLTALEISLQSSLLCGQISRSTVWTQARRIALFSALPQEPNLNALAEEAWATNRQIAFPKVDPNQKTLSFHLIHSWKDLRPGAYGILEPINPTEETVLSALDLICIPGLGFDRKGVRLGRGAGFYDRFLASVNAPLLKLGVFFSIQEAPSLPDLAHDIRLDGIATEKELFLF